MAFFFLTFPPLYLQMDPLLSTLTECSPWNEADTPRTRDLNHLRAKRVAYYESIGIIKDDASRNGSQQVSTSSQDTKVSPSENPTFVLRGPQKPPPYLAIGKTPLLQEVPRVAPRETEQCLDQGTQQAPWRESYPTDLDLHLLEDALVPETQKLRHVINWAQKFLSNAPEEQGLKSPKTSLGLPRSNLCQSSKALGSKRNAHVRSSDSPPLLREDQSSTRTDIHSCSLRPQDNLSEMGLFSECSSFFQKEGFLDSQSCVWRGIAVRNEGEGRAAGYPPDRLQQEDYAQRKYNRARGSHIQDPNGDEKLGAQPQLRLTSEESDVSKEAGQSPPRHGYFWAPLMDSSEEECLDEPEESKGTLPRGVLGRKCRGFSGIASSPPSESTLMLKTMVPSGVPSSGEILLEAEVREECTGAVQSPVGTPKDVTVEFRDDISRGEDPIPRLPVGQLMPPYDSSNQKRKESDNMGFTLWLPKSGIKHKKKWKHVTTESSGKTIMGRGPRGGLNRSMQSSAKSSPPAITQRQFDLTHPESYVTPQIASLSHSVSEGPLESAMSHGPIAEARGTHSSTWFDQMPPPKMDDGSVQTPRAVTRQTTHEKKEKTLSSDHPISRDISNTGLKGSFPLKDVGDSVSWRDEPPHEPEQEASVLETYFYYLRMLNKIRGLPSKGGSCSLPFQGPRLSKSDPVITSAEGKGQSKGASLDRETKEWRDGCESDMALEGEGDTCPQGRGCVEEATPEETGLWKPQGNYGMKPKLGKESHEQ